jgi:hypothetical protein
VKRQILVRCAVGTCLMASIELFMATTPRNLAYSVPKIPEARPECIVETWVATNTANAPLERRLHTAVWTGTEMIVWGGYQGINLPGAGGTGGRYNPIANS